MEYSVGDYMVEVEVEGVGEGMKQLILQCAPESPRAHRVHLENGDTLEFIIGAAPPHGCWVVLEVVLCMYGEWKVWRERVGRLRYTRR